MDVAVQTGAGCGVKVGVQVGVCGVSVGGIGIDVNIGEADAVGKSVGEGFGEVGIGT